jgi:hypothetical protein
VSETPKASKSKKSRIISTVLSPALQLWLRSQVEQIEALQFKVMGGDRQILSGHIPTVTVTANHAVYQGLHLSRIQLEGTDIRVNLSQVIKGKPLQLLAPVPVVGQLLLQQTDLQASLQAPLLSKALTELLDTLVKSDETTNLVDYIKAKQVTWQQIDIDAEQLTLRGNLADTDLRTAPLVIRAGLQLVTPSVLQLNPLQIQIEPVLPAKNFTAFQIDLGRDVELQELTLSSGQLICGGRLNVIP